MTTNRELFEYVFRKGFECARYDNRKTRFLGSDIVEPASEEDIEEAWEIFQQYYVGENIEEGEEGER